MLKLVLTSFVILSATSSLSFAGEQELRSEYIKISQLRIDEARRAQEQAMAAENIKDFSKHQATLEAVRESLANELGQEIIESTPINVVKRENSLAGVPKSREEIFGDTWIKLADNTICYIRYAHTKGLQEYLFFPTRMATCKTVDNKLIKKGFDRKGDIAKDSVFNPTSERGLYLYDKDGINCSYKNSHCEVGQKNYLSYSMRLFN